MSGFSWTTAESAPVGSSSEGLAGVRVTIPLVAAFLPSLVAFTAYLYLLNTVRPALATSYAYVNPPVAVVIGALFGGERVHAFDVVSMSVILAGVALIALGRTKRR